MKILRSQKVHSLRIREIYRPGRLGKNTHHQNAPFWALCQNTQLQSGNDHIQVDNLTVAAEWGQLLVSVLCPFYAH